MNRDSARDRLAIGDSRHHHLRAGGVSRASGSHHRHREGVGTPVPREGDGQCPAFARRNGSDDVTHVLVEHHREAIAVLGQRTDQNGLARPRRVEGDPLAWQSPREVALHVHDVDLPDDDCRHRREGQGGLRVGVYADDVGFPDGLDVERRHDDDAHGLGVRGGREGNPCGTRSISGDGACPRQSWRPAVGTVVPATVAVPPAIEVELVSDRGVGRKRAVRHGCLGVVRRRLDDVRARVTPAANDGEFDLPPNRKPGEVDRVEIVDHTVLVLDLQNPKFRVRGGGARSPTAAHGTQHCPEGNEGNQDCVEHTICQGSSLAFSTVPLTGRFRSSSKHGRLSPLG